MAVATSFLATTALCWLSFLEHSRSLRPSDIIVSYLSASTVCDVVFSLASWPYFYYAPTPARLFMRLYTAQMLVKLILLLLENMGKESALYPRYKDLAPEETSGLLQRTLFWWVNRVLADGHKGILRAQDLPALPQSLSSRALRGAMLAAWDRRG